MYRVEPQVTRHLFAILGVIATVVQITVAAPSAGARAAKPDACQYVDAAQMLQLTGRKDLLGKGPQPQDPSEIPNNTSGCHFLGVLFVLDTPFPAERFARGRTIIEKSNSAFKGQTVSGVGDEAYVTWDTTPGNHRSVLLAFRSGNKRISIEDLVASDSVETVKKWLIAMGKTAASRAK